MASSEAYTSLFTGDELDYAVAKALGNKYRGNITPGCHLIGDTVEMAIDLDALLIPGAYTVYFYTNGPEALATGTEEEIDENPLRAFSVRPLYLKIYATGGDHLYQMVLVGAMLYFRDMWSAEDKDPITGHIPWRSLDLGVEGTVITNNLEYSEGGTLEALSQRMGTALVDAIRKLQIGNSNLLDFTNGFYMYGDRTNSANEMKYHWDCIYGDIDMVTYDDIIDGSITFPSGSAINITKFPLFDDIDDTIIAMFKSSSTSNDAIFTSDPENNKIYMTNNAQYTASVYLLYDTRFASMSDNAEAFISLRIGSNTIRTRSIKLNRLVSPAEYSGPATDLYCYNKILVGTDYDTSYEDKPDWTDTYNGKFKVIEPSASQLGYYRLTVTVDPSDLSDRSDLDNISIQFGFSNAYGIFVLPKVEYGEYATQYCHSWGDLQYYFVNCEEFFGVPIDVTGPSDFNEDDGFVFVPEKTVEGQTIPAHFSAEPIAVGGGGGFVIHTEDDLTIFNNTERNDYYVALDALDMLKISYAPDGQTPITVNDQHTYDGQYGPNLMTYSDFNSRYDKVLVFNKMTSELLYWDNLYNNGQGNDPGAYVSLNKPFVIRECATSGGADVNGPKSVDYSTDKSYTEAYAGKNTFWLDKPHSGSTSKAATIKYFDPEENAWMTAVAAASKVYVVSETAPGREALGLFWIQSTTNALYYSVEELVNGVMTVVWKPIESIWGANPSN